ncbi:TIGR02450 family Trp-rich protein [Marinicella sp. S1101]|uniref:TIGR02450 family Trp-rich protein n=1 Tax=Marinicella marina TaxID=2996016 RepID=UPI0024BCD9A0|nr:TIGR02450 family Trp-rich protein [Marinicella marina]MCX7553366.1 TIGR02450 family Trp-rich protein [Marinicella marina]MDJ1139098.1 TIGR02450 family Trp-rich protein [Marinicella marina]
MSPITPTNPKKLRNSKWTSLHPENREKHFLITRIEQQKNGEINHCQIQAVLTKRTFLINVSELNDKRKWCHGWL